MKKRLLTLLALSCCLGLFGCDSDSESSEPSDNAQCEEGEDCSDSGEKETDQGKDDKKTDQDNDDKKTDKDNTDKAPVVEKDACDNQCTKNEYCDEDKAICVPKCVEGETLCHNKCLVLADLHLEGCDKCSQNYCDSNDDFSDGCDIDATKDDVNNCGACGKKCEEGQVCEAGNCKPICQDGETDCNGQCLKLSELSMTACDTCVENYCNGDDDWTNGCEVNALGDDVKHCGACGNACDEGQSCLSGSCFKPFRVMVMKDNAVRSERDGGTKSGAKYDYVKVVGEEVDGWYPVMANDQEAWVKVSDTMDICEECEGRAAIDYAETFLYSKTNMCTYDHYLESVKNESPLLNYSKTSSCCGYGDNCANFVTTVLQTFDLLSGHSKGVGGVEDLCKKDGYQKLSDKTKAKAGDVWFCGGQHVELVVGVYNGTVYLIASNNFSGPCGSSCSSCSGDGYQRVSYNNENWCEKTRVIYSRQQD